MKCEIRDGIPKRDEYVQIRQGSTNSAPQSRLATDAAPQYRFADGGAKRNLGQGVHGSRRFFVVTESVMSAPTPGKRDRNTAGGRKSFRVGYLHHR